MPPFNIAIIGGGPAGLTLANLLLSTPTANPINVTIFERDPSASARTTKGGTLDLHSDTGLAALDAAGLRPAFDARARSDIRSGAVAFTNRHGTRLLTLSGAVDGANPRPEIDRGVLTTILVEALPEGIIRYGSHLSSITPDGALVFSTGGVEETVGKYDLVVGAEGAWSKVHAHISDSRPVFSGISGFELHVSDPDTTHPELSREVGHGLHFALGGKRALIGQRLGSGAIMVYAMASTEGPGDPQELIDECGGDLALVQALLQKRYENAGWAPELCKWIEAADPTSIRGWPLYEYVLPDGHTYAHRPGWTLVGDAAHVVTPFAGEGVNAAMRDALELAKRIRKVAEDGHGGALDKAVREYEEEMFERLRPVMAETLQNKEGMFDEGAPESMIKRMKEIMSRGPPTGA